MRLSPLTKGRLHFQHRRLPQDDAPSPPLPPGQPSSAGGHRPGEMLAPAGGSGAALAPPRVRPGETLAGRGRGGKGEGQSHESRALAPGSGPREPTPPPRAARARGDATGGGRSLPPPGARAEEGPEGCGDKGTRVALKGRGSEGGAWREVGQHLTRQGGAGGGIGTRAGAPLAQLGPRAVVPFPRENRDAGMVQCDRRFCQLRLISEAVLDEHGGRNGCRSDCYSPALQQGWSKPERHPGKPSLYPRARLAYARRLSWARVSKGSRWRAARLPAEPPRSGKPNRLAKPAREQ